MKVNAYCWTCNKEYDVSRWTGKKYGVKCTDCGGYVISPSGKIKFRIVGDCTKPPDFQHNNPNTRKVDKI